MSSYISKKSFPGEIPLFRGEPSHLPSPLLHLFLAMLKGSEFIARIALDGTTQRMNS
jgi:hypothetical protein